MVMTSEVKKYDAYKDSKIDWLGEIPAEWETKKIKFLFKIGRGRVISQQELDENGTYPVFSSQTQNNGILGYISTYDFDCEQITWTTDGANAGTIFLRDGKHNCTNVCGTLQPRKSSSVCLSFLSYSLSIAAQFYKRPDTNGAKIMNGEMADIFVTLPSLDEQVAIGRYLDAVITQIDDAIAIKEKQIALLKERKQIIIQKAVTQGLNPNVPMKDSGVDWIGQIPEHWKILANRALFSERVEAGREDLPLLSVSIHSGVSSEEISEEENVRGRVKIEDKTKYILVKPSDIAFNMMRAWQGGIGAVSTEGMVSPAYIVAKPKPKINAEYFENQYRCPEFIQQMDRFSKGITDFRKRLYWDGFKQLLTVVPPIDEQLEIVEYIKQETMRVASSIELLNCQIEKLKEYKTTLINSAVTGKIKVA